jgi:hypothetical protein
MDFAVQAVLVVGGIFLLIVVASLAYAFRPQRQRMFTPLELDEIRLRHEEERAALVDEKIVALEARKRLCAYNVQILTARTETDRMVDEAGGGAFDAKGRAVYGEAWDTATNGQLPLKSV